MPKRKMRERSKLVRELLKVPVSRVQFSDGRISLRFYGHTIRDKIVVRKEDNVAEWSRRHKQVFVDRELGKKDLNKSFRALAVHEAVEKFLVEKLHLKCDEEAHVVATQKEKEFLKKEGGNWRSHELIVYWNWHKQGEH
ncbi:MAG: hypothetical protein V1847_00275 [Candidatus Diapherotrites archaeon]